MKLFGIKLLLHIENIYKFKKIKQK